MCVGRGGVNVERMLGHVFQSTNSYNKRDVWDLCY